MTVTHHFLQGIFGFVGAGLGTPVTVHEGLRWTVPEGSAGQVLYFRGGNSSGELVIAVLARSGEAMRYFPIAARGDVHVPLRVVQDLAPGEIVEVLLCAPEGVQGTVVIDLGLAQTDAAHPHGP